MLFVAIIIMAITQIAVEKKRSHVPREEYLR